MNILKIFSKRKYSNKNQDIIEEGYNLLYRKDFIESVDSTKIWNKSMTIPEIKELLCFLENKLANYKFEIDNNYIKNSRRKGLKESIVNRLSKDNVSKEEILESLFNFWEIVHDEYFGDYISVSKELNINVQELTIMDQNYRNKGIICTQEKDDIIDIIKILKESLNEK